MPTYDFTCIHCEHATSVTGSIHATITAPICTSCAAVMVRSYDFSGVEFKGDGFYSTEGKQ
jgi:putative FmdB family regulatory protein